MTAKKSGAASGPLGFLKQITSSDASASGETAGSGKEVWVDTVPEMAQLFITVLKERLPVRIFLGDATLPYYSQFEWELAEDSEGKVVDSKTHLEEGLYLLLAALDPPIGNLKIRSATKISVEFFTRHHLLDCKVHLKKITGTRKLCMSFPEKIRKKPQKRSSYRAPVDRRMNLLASVTRPSGVVFKALFTDLGNGGAAFVPTGATPRIADHSRVEMEITYPEGHVSVDAIIRGSFAKEGDQVFRAQFLVANHKIAGELDALASYVQRGNIQKRVETFE